MDNLDSLVFHGYKFEIEYVVMNYIYHQNRVYSLCNEVSSTQKETPETT